MTEENQPAPQDPALDAFASAGYQIEGYNSTVPKEDEATATSKEGEVKNEVGNESHLTQGETPTSTNENTETEENTETKTQGQNDSFDESKYLEEISNSRFKTREELAEAISRSEQYDQLRDAYDKLEDHEPEFANSLVRELNSFVANGGDANTFINFSQKASLTEDEKQTALLWQIVMLILFIGVIVIGIWWFRFKR